ncbi:MAG: septation protein A [Gammaproteobacteria bacterium]|nr:septation protein A [Gammaproteobacteria bacterium]NIM71616.1 septation protein A [Gammaproteobacteria bacterium]NIN37164.1 septation protein A [Gammaproteobacteria bacterium]NIO23356.1 septation protein A [Gammaproteobacteria bacterium]NIO63984.1 septation protein A [Gammaproteobacteria bacterium]
MKLLFDFFPLLLFFITFKSYPDPKQGILAATAVIIVATGVQVSVTWWRQRRVEKVHLITLALLVSMGGVTLLLQDEIYIKWKATVFFWLLAVAFLGSHFVGSKTLVQRFFDSKFEPPASVWTALNLSWVLFFLSIGALNLFVVYNFSTDTWVNFKLFGLTALMFAFVFAQVLYLVRYMIPEQDGEEQG